MAYSLTDRNHERAVAAATGLNAYRIAKGEGSPISGDTVRDILQDMMHWAAQNPSDAYIETADEARDEVKRLCECAWNDFPNEAGTESEDE